MKFICLIFSFLLLLSFLSCKDMPETLENIPEVEVIPNIEDDATNGLKTLPEKKCYLYAVDNDSIALNITKTADNVKGNIRYNFHQIDGSIGTFDGFMKGDTIRGFYDFKAEGTNSKRELIFLQKDGMLVQGNGETVLNGSTETFKKNTSFTFKDGRVLKSITCPSGIL